MQTTPRATPVQTTPGTFVLTQAGVPQTIGEYRALRQRISDLREQLQDAAERRNSVAGQLRDADEGARAGYIERLKLLDSRILALETEISNSVGRLAAAPAFATAVSVRQGPGPEQVAAQIVDDIVPIVAIFSVFVLGPFAIAISRFIWKRSQPAPKAIPDRVTQDRLEQLQQSMDAIAIEVERISEGQRFVTRIMSDRALGAGQGEPASASKRTAVGSDRG